MPFPAPRRVGRGEAPNKTKKAPPRTISHKFRAQDFVRKRQNEAVTDHYTLGKLLGDGQFGEVFIGTVKIKQSNNGGKGDNRAIKRIQKELLTEEDHDEVFNEFMTLKQMDHPSIVKMYEFFEDSHSFWFVQELCSGGELLDELERIENFTEATAGLIMKQVLSSVLYCHSQKKVVHRDLKLENILLEEQGTQSKMINADYYNPMIVKVIDFGLATTFTDDQVLTSPVGSMHYIAPEVLEQEYRGGTCDIWSCGVIAYILLCGYAPFEAANDRDMRELIMMGHVSFEDPIWQNNVSKEAKEFVSYLLTYEPDKRPDAAQALQHPWLQNASKAQSQQFKATKTGTDAAVKFLTNCRNFEAASKLKQATCAFMTSQLVFSAGGEGDEESTELVGDASTATMIGEIFRAIDLDSDGRLSQEESRIGFQDFLGDQSLTVEEADDIFERMDLSCTGYVDYSEFFISCLGLHNQDQAHHQKLLKQAFERLLDKDGSGFISHEKLRVEMAPFYGEDVEKAIIQKIIDQADADQDGQISWGDFEAMMCKTADFVPPEDATPLAAFKDGSNKATKESSSQEESAPAPAAEDSTTAETETTETQKENAAPEAVPGLPVEAATKTPTTPGRKVRSSAGPRARLISAMFEKNLEKNRERGFDHLSYIGKQSQSKGPKRKLPRTRRVNFEELTKKASTQVDFDARTKMQKRNMEIELLNKANPGRARQRRATIVSMLQQDKVDVQRKARLLKELEGVKGHNNSKSRRNIRASWNSATLKGEQRRAQRIEELLDIRKSMRDDNAAKKRLFESWSQADVRKSTAEKRTSRLEALKELKEFHETFEQPENLVGNPERFASRRASMPANAAMVRRSSRKWTKRLSGKSLIRESIRENSTHSRRSLDRSSSHTALYDLEEREERLVKIQPKAKTRVSARRVEPIRRLNSFDSDQEQDERDQRLGDMVPDGNLVIEREPATQALNIRRGSDALPAPVPQTLKFPRKPACPPARGRLSSYENPFQKDERLREMQQENAMQGGRGVMSVPIRSMFKSASLRFQTQDFSEREDLHTPAVTAARREARFQELRQIKQQKLGRAKNARVQFEEKIQAALKRRSLDSDLAKSRNMSVMGKSDDEPQEDSFENQNKRTSTDATNEDKGRYAMGVSHHDEKRQDEFSEEGGAIGDVLSGKSSVEQDETTNHNSFVVLSDDIRNASFGGSKDSMAAGSIGDLAERGGLPEVSSPRREQFKHSSPELGSPRPEYERPAPKDPNKHIVTPKNFPRFGPPTPKGKGRTRRPVGHFKPKGRSSASASEMNSSADSGLTMAQEKFLELAKERAVAAAENEITQGIFY